MFCTHFTLQDGWSALMFASICRGNSDTVRVLLTAGAQVDLQNMVRYSICVLQ